jgi:nitrogen-specific signal transduction histidine kinase/ActR/RegA family two-component response regulator
MVGLIEDITEVRHTEEQLLQAQKMEAVGRLAGGIAHDFNNLLTVIVGYSDFLIEDLGADHRAVASVNEIRTAAQSAERLTRQLLAFSRRQILQPQSLDLNDVLRRVDALLRRVIGEDVVLHMKVRIPLPRVSADPGQIEQVIMNLAVNARDAMPHGGVLTIETDAVELDETYVARHAGSSVGTHVMVAVSDTGHGIDEATHKRLFEPFFTTKEPGKGTGLGLATAYGIVKQSHGSIWVYSELGHGSTFKVYLPATTELPVESLTPQPTSLAGTETILIVEDQVEARAVIRETLLRRGYVVVEAGNGPEALQVCEQHPGPIHALLTDVVMPGMSGRHLAEILATQRPGLRIIYMSGYTDDAIVRHGVLDSGLSFVQKPFTATSLLQKIREALDKEPT